MHEPGMDEWVANLEYVGRVNGDHKFVSTTLQFDDFEMDFYHEELVAEIDNGLVFEQI